MSKTDENEAPRPAPVEQHASVDKLAQLTAQQVLNAVSIAAQDAARAATGNETRDAFIAFNRSLIKQFGGGDERLPVG